MPSFEQIVAYIKQHQAKYGAAVLRAQLLKQGVAAADVDKAIATATGAAPAPEQAPPPTAAPSSPQTQPPAARTMDLSKKTGPISGMPPGYRRPEAPPVMPPKRSFILVVDDDEIIRDLIVDRLQMAEYKVTCAEDAAQAVIQAEGMTLALLITDIEMPGFGSGIDAVKKLRTSPSVPKNLPVIFVTGMSPQDVEKRVPLKDPYVRLIHKPIDWKLLRAYIKDLITWDKPLEQ